MRIQVMVVGLLLVSGLAACDDPNAGLFNPVIREDTVDLAAPLVDRATPTALRGSNPAFSAGSDPGHGGARLSAVAASPYI